MKGEFLDQAFNRITESETGTRYEIGNASLLGAFTHFYENNMAEVEGITTHYVVLAYGLTSMEDCLPGCMEQHTEYEWIGTDILTSGEYDTGERIIVLKHIHPNTLEYFKITSD
jgi:colanic acid biosynthesis protein WcaH